MQGCVVCEWVGEGLYVGNKKKRRDGVEVRAVERRVAVVVVALVVAVVVVVGLMMMKKKEKKKKEKV